MLSTSFLSRFVILLSACLLFFHGCATTKETAEVSLYADRGFRIAVFPFENLSGTPVPIKEIRQGLIGNLKRQGFFVLDDDALEKFMARHRIRYTGGIDQGTAKAFKEETGTEGVLITAMELLTDVNPPKVALISRLVSTGDNPVILWMDGVGLAGDDSPGILGLGLIEDTQVLLKKALQSLSNSLTDYVLTRKGKDGLRSVQRRFRPKTSYRSPEMERDKKYTLAIIPFFNKTERKNAAEILALQFARQLTALGYFDVIELGVIRQKLLNARIIMDEGISLPDVDFVANSLNADLILTGKVMDYQDYQGFSGKPKVDFSIVVIERKSRKIVWSSTSHNEGDDGVLLFDWGKINTAHAMVSKMARSIGEMMAK